MFPSDPSSRRSFSQQRHHFSLSRARRKSEERRPTNRAARFPGVTIVITNEETGRLPRGHERSRTAATSRRSSCQGVTSITAKLASFRNFERGGLVLAVGKTLTINVTMIARRARRNRDGHGRIAARRHDERQGRRQHRHRRAERAAGDEPQLLLRPSRCCRAFSSRRPTRWATTPSSPAASRRRTTTSRWTAATTATTRSAPARARRCARRSKRSRNSRCSPACMTRSSAAPAARSSTRSPSRARTSSRAWSSRRRPATS